jgi:DNA-binding response OmpR family regulator
MVSVLVVDDERDIREAVAEVLKAEGYEVIDARDGAEALLQLRAHHPAVVLLDLMMPGMNGWEFCAARKREPDLDRIPIIVISALGKVSGIDAAAFLQKPFELDTLVSTVRHYADPGARTGGTEYGAHA